MIVIAEGINGSGKTSLCEQLERRTRWPVFRSFRRAGRNFNEIVEGMRQIGIPVNSYIEDVLVAEVLGQVGRNVILDRSLPSAIAYGSLYGEFDENDPRIKSWMDVWQESLLQGGGPVVYLYLGCCYEDSKKRCKHEKFPLEDEKDWWHVATQLDRTCGMVNRIPKLSIDTSGYGPTVTLEVAKRFIDEHKRQNQGNVSKGREFPGWNCAHD